MAIPSCDVLISIGIVEELVVVVVVPFEEDEDDEEDEEEEEEPVEEVNEGEECKETGKEDERAGPVAVAPEVEVADVELVKEKS